MRTLTLLGALFGLAAVLLGAFGAHGLVDRVSPERLDVWHTAAHYLGWHATTLLVLGLGVAGRLASRLALAGGVCLALGSLVFSGSLFVLVLSDVGAWGAVTPFGGVLLAVGWGLLALAAVRAPGAV